jgi:hypothetical protein
MKPIWNAAFSSLVTKAGTSTLSDNSSAVDCRLVAELHEKSEIGFARLFKHNRS